MLATGRGAKCDSTRGAPAGVTEHDLHMKNAWGFSLRLFYLCLALRPMGHFLHDYFDPIVENGATFVASFWPWIMIFTDL